MTSNTAPLPNFIGIDFNDSFFPSVAGDYVEYPVAQGPVTIGTLYSYVIDVVSSSTAFNLFSSLVANLNIATNGGAGQTIRIGATTGASVHCANIDHQGNSINNSTNASGGTVNLCNNMTTGTLNVGTNTARSGNVNIGNGVGATGSVIIGSSTSPTTVGGTLTSTGLLTASGGLSSTSGAITTGGNISTTGTGNITSAGLITGVSGILSGNSAFGICTTNFTIPSTINRDYYLFCNTSGTPYSVILPARLVNQYVRLRNFSGQTLNVTAPTTTPATVIYPTGSTTSFTTTWNNFLNNTVLTLYCDGNNWLGF